MNELGVVHCVMNELGVVHCVMNELGIVHCVMNELGVMHCVMNDLEEDCFVMVSYHTPYQTPHIHHLIQDQHFFPGGGEIDQKFHFQNCSLIFYDGEWFTSHSCLIFPLFSISPFLFPPFFHWFNFFINLLPLTLIKHLNVFIRCQISCSTSKQQHLPEG